MRTCSSFISCFRRIMSLSRPFSWPWASFLSNRSTVISNWFTTFSTDVDKSITLTFPNGKPKEDGSSRKNKCQINKRIFDDKKWSEIAIHNWVENCVMCTKKLVPPKVPFIWTEHRETIYCSKGHRTNISNDQFWKNFDP